MGQFNHFINNNDIPSINEVLRAEPYLTNANRSALRRAHVRNNATAYNKISNLTQARLQKTNITKLVTGPLQLGFFNAIVNKDYDTKTVRVNLENVINKPLPGRVKLPGTQLDIDVVNVKLVYGRYTGGVERTKNGLVGKFNPAVNYFMAQITANVYDGDVRQGVNFRVYKNGKIHFSGGFMNNDITHAGKIQKYIVDNLTNRESFLYNSIIYNNITGQFKINGVFDLTKVARTFAKTGKVDYEPELQASLRMEYKGRTFQLFTSGVVQILGVLTNADMLSSYDIGKSLVGELLVLQCARLTSVDVVDRVTKRRVAKVVVSEKNTKNISYDKNKKILISKKMCMSHSKPELMSLAKKIGIMNLKSTTTKSELCERIQKHVYGNFAVNGHPCKSYSKEYLTTVAMTKNISVSDTDTVDTLCEKLKMPAPVRRQPSKTKTATKTANITANNYKKRGLNNASVKSNIEKLYGDKWMTKYKNVMQPLNKNVVEMQKIINALNLKKNKKGVPFKKGVDQVKKTTVRTWKSQRKVELNKKLNELNNAFAKNLENFMNVATPSPPKKNVKKSRFPKGTRVETL
ncbi:MAG: hypothetical protein HOI07_05935 [Betaproteobacteria bacterium]|jgi:hypothetical protein|nr:hypothetical protein [Betaproteobacteria bacterium]